MNLLSAPSRAFGIGLPPLSPLSLACVRKKQLLRLFLLGDTRSFLTRVRDNGDNGPLVARGSWRRRAWDTDRPTRAWTSQATTS